MSQVFPFCPLFAHEKTIKWQVCQASQSELVTKGDHNGSGEGNSFTSILELDVFPVNSQGIPQKISFKFQLGLPNDISLD